MPDTSSADSPAAADGCPAQPISLKRLLEVLQAAGGTYGGFDPQSADGIAVRFMADGVLLPLERIGQSVSKPEVTLELRGPDGSGQDGAGTDDPLRRLAEWIVALDTKDRRGAFRLPKPVSAMTPDEHAIFAICASLLGRFQFFAGAARRALKQAGTDGWTAPGSAESPADGAIGQEPVGCHEDEPDAEAMQAFRILARLRADGWMVGVHNDYRLNGEPRTFWLLTHANGRWIKGEGTTDASALAEADLAREI